MVNWQEIKTASNLFSLLRLFMAIPFWLLLDNLQDNRYLILVLCLFAALTDVLDGYLARKLNQVTELGKIIDPLADKVAMGAIIVKLYLIEAVPAYYFFMIVGRDILIFLGGLIVSKTLNRVLPSNVLGKITVMNIGIVILMILLQVERTSLIFSVIYLASIALIFISLIAYAIRAVEFIKQDKYGTVR